MEGVRHIDRPRMVATIASLGQSRKSRSLKSLDIRGRVWYLVRIGLFAVLFSGSLFLVELAEASLPSALCTNSSNSWTKEDKILLKEIARLRDAYNKALIKVRGMRKIAACSIERRIVEHLVVDEEYTDESYEYFECVLEYYSKLC